MAINADMLQTEAGRSRAADEFGHIEAHGADRIPATERNGKPSEFFWIWHSAQFSLALVVLGSLPVIFGLGWWASVTALLSGIAVGTVVFAPLARFGHRTGSNDAVSSAAHFGIRGRAISSAITICVSIGFYAISVWTGGTALVAAGDRFAGTPTGNGALIISMAMVGMATVLVAIYGHATLLATYRVTTVISGLLLLALVLVLAPKFHAGGPAGTYALGSFWPTWVLAASVGASQPISYSTFQGDYSRYLAPALKDRTIVIWNAAGMFLSMSIALLIGAYVTTLLQDPAAPFVEAVIGIVPAWFVPFLVALAAIGTVTQGGLCLYNAGLAANASLWRCSRVLTTLLVSGLGLAAVFLGVIVFNAIDSITAFVLILLVVISPWSAIMLVGFALRGGRYAADDVQSFRRQSHGAYWFTAGFNIRAVVPFAAGAIVGALFANTSIYTGPLANAVNGIDLSYSSAFVVAAAGYWALDRLFPEPGAISAPAPTD